MDTKKETVRKSIHFGSPEYLPLLYHGTERIEKSDAVMLPVEEMFGGEEGLWSEWGFRWAENNKSFKLGALKRGQKQCGASFGSGRRIYRFCLGLQNSESTRFI